MKISLNWLKQHIKLNYSAIDIISKLNLSGTEVEFVQSLIDEKIVVAKVLSIKPHPNADRLQLVTVDNGKNEIKLICGAKNVAIGQHVALAQTGAKLPEIEIKPVNIRGVDSFGMLCSEKELGISNNDNGIIVLGKKHKIGTPLNIYFHSDTILGLDITPNRGDCLSHLGIARELSAIYHSPLILDNINIDVNSKLANLDIKVLDKRACPQYYGLKISNITITESPDWLKEKLSLCGIKPINNVVDAANYIMLDSGQPLHTFDAKKISNSKIVVKYAKANEKIMCLDDIERKLNPETLVICDDIKPIAIAGIIGGKYSAIDNNTKEIIIEAAEFDSAIIRKMMKTLKITTEASYRYERKIDSNNIKNSLLAAANLITKLAGGKISSSITFIGDRMPDSKIKIEYDKINNLLGLKLSKLEIDKILIGLGFIIKKECFIPSWRHDIHVWQDLAEEVGRIYGYDKIKTSKMSRDIKPHQSSYYLKEHIKDILFDDGFCEVLNYSFIAKPDNVNNLLEVANPLQPENKYLRDNLSEGILKSIAKNPSFDIIKIFEIGNVFNQLQETTILTITQAQNKNFDFKDYLQILAKKIHTTVELLLKQGKLFKADAAILNKYKIRKQNVFIYSIDTNVLANIIKHNKFQLTAIKLDDICYHQVSKFESVARDLAFIVDQNISAEKIKNEILKTNNKVILVELFDEFIFDKSSTELIKKDLFNRKNIAYHIWLQDSSKSINTQTADEIIEQIVNKITKKYNATLRTQ